MENVNTEITGTSFLFFSSFIIATYCWKEGRKEGKNEKKRNCGDLIRHSIPSIEHRTSKPLKEGRMQARKQ